MRNVAPVVSDLALHHPEAEIVAVDDGSTDGTFEALERCALDRTALVVHRLPRHLGQSAAIFAGLRLARGEVLAVVDGDGQTDTAEIKRLLPYLADHDFANGCRAARQDDAGRRLASRLANALRRAATGDGMRDTGGTPKVMRRACLDHLVPFDGLHRFLPALLVGAGLRVIEVPVSHRPRLHGTTKYSHLGRALRGAWDLLGVRWWLARRYDPRTLGLRPTESEGDAAQRRRQ